jgi:hypothetical protein
MGPTDLLRRLVDVLERLKIKYLVAGSMASTSYGEPRFTNDIDVVIDLPLAQVDSFCQSFPAPEFYCYREAVVRAVRQRFQFNIIHLESGLKIDVFIPDGSEFSRTQLNRAVRACVPPGFEAWFASPEDVILKKLEYFQEGGSEKHIRDIAGVLKVQADLVDRDYITAWAGRLGLADTWQAVLERVKNP